MNISLPTDDTAQYTKAFPALLKSRTSLKAMRVVAVQESRVKMRLQLSSSFFVDQPKIAPAVRRRRIRQALAGIAGVLELRCFLCGFAEALHLVGVGTLTEAVERAAEIMKFAETISGQNVLEIMASNPTVFPAPDLAAARLEDSLPANNLLEKTAAAARSLLPLVDVDAVKRAADEIGAPELGHRCRMAVERLCAFLARNGPQRDAKLSVAGPAYLERRLSLDEVCVFLQLPRSDAVALLEQYGFARPEENIRLSSAARNALLERIQEDRDARQGEPDPRPSHIAREVVATQRIEGVDARPWLPPENE